MAEKENKKNKKKSTVGTAAQKMLLGGQMTEEQEEILTPTQMVFRSFIHDKVAMAGVCCFFIYFCMLFGIAYFLAH